MVRRCENPSCSRELVEPYGNPDAQILVIGEYPGQNELKAHRAWVGPAGHVLALEMERIGLQDYFATNVWLHEPDQPCLEHHMKELWEEISKRKYILILGSDAVKLIHGYSVMEVSGLWRGNIVYGVNPAVVLRENSVYGEVKHCFDIFGKIVRQGENL